MSGDISQLPPQVQQRLLRLQQLQQTLQGMMAQKQQIADNLIKNIIIQILDKFNDDELYKFAEKLNKYYTAVSWTWDDKIPTTVEIVTHMKILIYKFLRELIKRDKHSLNFCLGSGGIMVKGTLISSGEYYVSIGFEDEIERYIELKEA